MSDLNWCTHCDNAISPSSDSLYCSEKCLRSDALNHHPSLGYKFPEFEHFLKDSSKEELTTIAMPRTGHSRKSFLFEIEDSFPTTSIPQRSQDRFCLVD
ncbi:hypothetical protein CU098_012920 [Rhizopus stolonifer]|uniref:Uncharacterized protein n=1 Tax=Rhizopus stolonifer TaxID=4846 RepID=A0A367KR82_RHIST|nr:hypothetical protein CU098_012920 [Rhizopus stolonifer]